MANIKEAWAAEADLGNRDPNNLNDHLQVSLFFIYFDVMIETVLLVLFYKLKKILTRVNRWNTWPKFQVVSF